MKASLFIILGFIVGLILSGVLIDVYSYVKGSVDKIIVARTISKAEQAVKDGNYQQAIQYYEKAYKKISPKKEANKALFAKVANNLGLSLYESSTANDKNNKDFFTSQATKAIELLKEAKAVFINMKNKKLAEETEQNIRLIETSL